MEKRELHYKYIISYLIVAIILLLALKYFDTPKLVDKLSFALTLSSLVLAILAIFHTIISGNKQDNQFIKLIETNSEIKNSAIEINKVSKEIGGLLSKVPKQFKSIENKLDSLSENEKNKSESIQQLPDNENNYVINKTKLMEMISRLQFTAMGVVYLFSQASKNNDTIDFSLFEELDLISWEYSIGVLTGFGSIGLLEVKVHEKTVVPTKCDQLLYDELPKMLDAVIKVIEEDQSKRLKAIIENIDKKYA